MDTIFVEFSNSIAGFTSDPSLFLPFLIITPMILCVFSGILGAIRQ